ncbi:MAG: type II secretion system F family protein [Pseudomonadota bacterium]
MPEYAYHAVDKLGRQADGTMVADTEQLLERRLREIGYWLIDAEVQVARKQTRRKKVPRQELIDFFNGATSLLKAGIPIADAIAAMAEETEQPVLRQILEDIGLNVQAGNDLSSSFRKFPKVFSEQVCNLVQAGEHGGNLVEVFTDISRHLAWVDRIIADVKQASIYPLMIIVAVAGLVGLMFVFVVPRFATIFAELELELPALTRGVVAIGLFAQQYWWAILLSLAALIIGIRQAARRVSAVARVIDRTKLSMPVFGSIQRLLVQSQFVHNLALMLKAGVPIVESLTLCKGLTNNSIMDTAISDAEIAVQRGNRVSDALRNHDIVSNLTLRMIIVGEDSGTLDEMLQQTADRFDEEIPRQIKRVFAIIEPMITLTLVAIVGLIAGAVFLPMFSLVQGIS